MDNEGSLDAHALNTPSGHNSRGHIDDAQRYRLNHGQLWSQGDAALGNFMARYLPPVKRAAAITAHDPSKTVFSQDARQHA
jgi:hypothetical protein